VRLGALLGPVPDAADPRALAEQVRAYAGEGYSSIWAAQTIGRGFMMMDPFVALAVAATVADRVEIGTAIVQAPLYPPMDLAHRVFSLQQICGPRLILGVGAGSTEPDFAAFGRPHASRFRDFTRSIETLRGIFETGGDGQSDLTPWPAVRGGPPLFLGSWGNGVERAARDFDGWIASAHYRTGDKVYAAATHDRRHGGGRAVVSTIQVAAGADLGVLKEKLTRFVEAGFDDAVVMILPGGPAPAAVRALVG
jgi:alkanesulfonate monooxygenase SsuD/methylene tetrahydromethanopterin reductase-like flavin-dependent oxidoreductase (luciferase family)